MYFGTAFQTSDATDWLNRASLSLHQWVFPLIAQAQEVAAEAEADGAAPGGPVGGLLEFLVNPINLILISAILFMFIVAGPQKKQRKQQEAALQGLKKNDRVVTNSGVHGIVIQPNVDEGTVILRIDENTGARMTVNRDTIATITPSDSKE